MNEDSQEVQRWATSIHLVWERLLFVVAVLGILVTVHLFIQQGIGFDRGCLGFSDPGTVDATFDCEAVTTSDASKLFGVSNAIWGIFYYLVVAAICASVAFFTFHRSWLKSGRFAIIATGFCYSAYLSYVQYFVLEDICALCLTSATVATVLFVFQVLEYYRPMTEKHSSLPKTPVVHQGTFYGGLTLLLVLIVGADLAYFNSLEDPAESHAAVEAQTTECSYDPEKAPIADFEALINPSDPFKGNAEADVIILEFFDPNCPHCKTLHPIMSEVALRYEDQVRIVYKPVPIWQHSVLQVAALFAAAEADKFFEMLDRQFALQRPEGLDMEQLMDIANRIGMDGDAMEEAIMDNQYLERLKRQGAQAEAANMTGVPMVILNGKVVARTSRTVACLGQFIEDEL